MTNNANEALLRLYHRFSLNLDGVHLAKHCGLRVAVRSLMG